MGLEEEVFAAMTAPEGVYSFMTLISDEIKKLNQKVIDLEEEVENLKNEILSINDQIDDNV